MSTPIWSPAPERTRGSRLYAFHEKLAARHGAPPPEPSAGSYLALHRWSVEQLETFWEAAWRDTGAAPPEAHRAVLTDPAMPPDRHDPDRVWFPGTRFNFARHLLRYADDRPALIAVTEDDRRRTVTYAELHGLVARCAAALERAGVAPGDRVAGFLPNTVETVVAMLGATALGAMWSSTSPDFGFQGVLDRFGQIDPKVLFVTDGYRYNGQVFDTLDKAHHLHEAIGAVETMVVVPFVDGDGALPPGAVRWDAFLGEAEAPAPAYPAFPFDHPVYVLYSSGTTGVPKCIVHGAGGTVVKHHVEQAFQSNLGRDDVLFYFTTCGWMMWNWLVSGLAQGATMVLYDGSPAWPQSDRLFALAAELDITIFGTSPKFLAGCEKGGLRPGRDHDLSRLRTMLSTGAPLEPNQFRYVYDAIKPDLQLASIAGGTDLIGCFMLGNPYAPVYPGEIQGPALGMDIAAFDGSGRPVIGEQGELVCRRPFPSMPVYFWNDPDGSRYRGAYFEDFPGVWRHGDYVTLTERGTVVVYGRSDATLNPGGVRIGTAEIYRVVEALPQVQDSIVVGHRRNGDVQVVLFVVLREGHDLTDGLRDEIRRAVRREASPRHVPAVILPIREVPVTINGKKVEVAVTRLLHGQGVQNRDALANPDALGQFEGLAL